LAIVRRGVSKNLKRSSDGMSLCAAPRSGAHRSVQAGSVREKRGHICGHIRGHKIQKK